MIITILLYFICSTVNVILNTVKSLFLIRYNNKMLNCAANAITYGFYTVVLKQIADTDLVTAVVVTILTNIIGVYVSMAITDRIDTASKLYKISLTAKDTTVEQDLIKYQLEYAINPVTYKGITLYNVEVYAKGKTEKNIMKELLAKYKINYNIQELKVTF